MYQEDWILREIENIVKFVARFIFKKDTIRYDIVDETRYLQSNLLYKEILKDLELLRINEAENLLFESIDAKNLGHLKIALEFYSSLNNLKDKDLIKAGFTRQEIKEGLEDVLKIYNINITNLMRN